MGKGLGCVLLLCWFCAGVVAKLPEFLIGTADKWKSQEGCAGDFGIMDVKSKKKTQLAVAACNDLFVVSAVDQKANQRLRTISWETWRIERSNPAYAPSRTNPFSRPELAEEDQLSALFGQFAATSRATNGGWCPMSTATRGGSVFEMTRDRTLVLKSLVNNEGSNIATDMSRVMLGDYPAALVPPLMFFSIDSMSFFVMAGLGRMGMRFNMPNLALYDVKGIFDRQGSEDNELRTKFHKGAGIKKEIWLTAANELVKALEFLVLARRMDYSMLITMLTKPLEELGDDPETNAMDQLDNGVFQAIDIQNFDLRNPKKGIYMMQLQGIIDHYETFDDKTTGVWGTLVNKIRVDQNLKSNPIQTRHRYACRMFVFLMIKLFRPINDAWQDVLRVPKAETFISLVSRCGAMEDLEAFARPIIDTWVA